MSAVLMAATFVVVHPSRRACSIRRRRWGSRPADRGSSTIFAIVYGDSRASRAALSAPPLGDGGAASVAARPRQHFLCFFPLPHGQGSLRPVFCARICGKCSDAGPARGYGADRSPARRLGPRGKHEAGPLTYAPFTVHSTS